MTKDPSSAVSHAAPVATRRNFRLSSLEILITILIFVGVLYLVTMWATNMFTPGEEAAAPAAPPGAMVERALASSEKVLAEQISQSRDLGALRKQVEALQAQARKTHGAGSADPVDAAQDRRLDEVDRRLDDINHRVGQGPDIKPLLSRLEKLEKDQTGKPAPTASGPVPAASADPQLLARLEKLEKELAARPAATPAAASQPDAKLLARLEKLEKELAARPSAASAAAPAGDAQLSARLDKLEKELAAKPANANPAAAALVQQESRLQRLEAGLSRLEKLEKNLASAPAAPSAASHRAESQPAPKAESKSSRSSRAESESRKQQTVTHKVRAGETLGGLARRYRVNEADIVRWNQLGTRRLLLTGESLVIYPGQNS